jgi:hypothetical protein
MPFLIVPKSDADVLNFANARFSTASTVAGLTNDESYVAYRITDPSPVFVPGPVPKRAPTTNKAIIVGDSRISPERALNKEAAYGGQDANQNNLGVPVYTARSLLNWIRSLSYERVDIELDFANHDVPAGTQPAPPPPGYRTISQGGQTIAEQYARLTTSNRLDAAIAQGGGFIIYFCGVNSIRQTASTDPQTIVDEATQMMTYLRSKGLPIILISDYPAFVGTGVSWAPAAQKFDTTGAQWTMQIALRNYYLSLAAEEDVTVVDSWALLMPAATIATSTRQAPSATAATYFEDWYLHQNGRGAAAVAKLLLPRLQAWFPAVPPLPSTDLVPLPPLTNTAIAATGGAGGTAPSGWTATGSNAGGVVHNFRPTTMVVGGVSVPAVEVEIVSGTIAAGGTLYYTRLEATATGISPGERFYVVADYELDAGATGIGAVDVLIQPLANGTQNTLQQNGDLLWRQSTDYAPDVAVKGRFRSGIVTAGATDNQIRVRFRVVFRRVDANNPAVNCTGTARFGNVCLVRAP